MAKVLKEANRIIRLWRDHGPRSKRIDLELAFREIVIPASHGDVCNIVYEGFTSFEGLMARKEKTREWVIGVNTNIDYLPRRNFTLAHEMGHFIAHRMLRDRFECTFDNLNDFDIQPLEAEANEFASHLLIPPDVVREFDKGTAFSHESVVELSALLGISMEAAAFRWIKLSSRPIGFAKSRDGFVDKGRASDRLYSMGVWFKQGSEIPASSLAASVTKGGDHRCEKLASGIWNERLPCQESSYATKREGYVYTYLDFDRV